MMLMDWLCRKTSTQTNNKQFYSLHIRQSDVVEHDGRHVSIWSKDLFPMLQPFIFYPALGHSFHLNDSTRSLGWISPLSSHEMIWKICDMYLLGKYILMEISTWSLLVKFALWQIKPQWQQMSFYFFREDKVWRFLWKKNLSLEGKKLICSR